MRWEKDQCWNYGWGSCQNQKVLKSKVVKLKAFPYEENSHDISFLKGTQIIQEYNLWSVEPQIEIYKQLYQ